MSGPTDRSAASGPADLSWRAGRHDPVGDVDRAVIQLLDPDTPPAALWALFDAFADCSVHEYVYFHPRGTVALRRHVRQHWVDLGGEEAFGEHYPPTDTPTAELARRWWRTRAEVVPVLLRLTSSDRDADRAILAGLRQLDREAALGIAHRLFGRLQECPAADRSVVRDQDDWEEWVGRHLDRLTDLI